MAKRQGVLPFQYEAEPDGDEVTAWGGLPMVVEAMKKLGVEHHAKELLDVKKRDTGFSSFQMLTSFVLLMIAGGDCLDDIRMLRDDKALSALLGHDLASADTMRRYLEQFHDAAAMKERPADGAWVAPENALLKGLGELVVKFVHAVALNEPEPITTATVDHDATVIEAHKQEARAHDKGGRGYQRTSPP